MYVISKEEVKAPLTTPPGERIYELVGEKESNGGASGHSLAHVVVPPGKSSAAHYHKISEETYYILAGTAHMAVDEQEFDLTVGQACLILPGESHQIFNQQDEELSFLVVCVPPWRAGDSYF